MNVITGRDRLEPDEELVRAERALARRVRSEVSKEYEPRLAAAGRWRRC
jgi:hypothetical protein